MEKRKDLSLVIMIIVIIAVLALGVVAIAPTVKNIATQKQAQALSERMQNGTATVSDLANSEGMKYDEYLAKYELSSDDVKADTNMVDFMEKLTLKNYCTFAGLEYSDEALEEYKVVYETAQAEAEEGEEKEDKVELTADTTDMEAKYGFAQYLYTKQQEELNGPVEVDTEAESEPEAE